jgi:nicotinamidase-related amidase
LAGLRVKRGDCVLVVVDVQERLIETVAEHQTVVRNIVALIKIATALEVPIVATEQEKLGDTVREIKAVLPNSPTRKLSFSCCDSLEFTGKLSSARRKTVIVCGVETHICVSQTVLDLLESRFRVLVVRDATSSHAVIDRETALLRLKASGAEVTTSEAIMYELIEKAGTDEFRRLLEVVKELRTSSLEPQPTHGSARPL